MAHDVGLPPNGTDLPISRRPSWRGFTQNARPDHRRPPGVGGHPARGARRARYGALFGAAPERADRRIRREHAGRGQLSGCRSGAPQVRPASVTTTDAPERNPTGTARPAIEDRPGRSGSRRHTGCPDGRDDQLAVASLDSGVPHRGDDLVDEVSGHPPVVLRVDERLNVAQEAPPRLGIQAQDK
jgi:hypothetical protein